MSKTSEVETDGGEHRWEQAGSVGLVEAKFLTFAEPPNEMELTCGGNWDRLPLPMRPMAS